MSYRRLAMRENDKEQIEARFICPGCDEKATAKDGDYCPLCEAFVHRECQKGNDGHKECPICGEPVG